jgi:hypothetical protein
MGSALAVISKSAFALLRDHAGNPAAVGAKIPVFSWDDTHPALDVLAKHGALYLVTERPDKALWLVAVLGASRRTATGWVARVQNVTPIVDITGLRAALGLGRLGTVARALDDRRGAILEYVAGAARSARAYVADVPDRLLEDAPAPDRSKAKPPRPPRLPKLVGELGPACLAQIADVLDELRAKPDRFLARAGGFVKDVQSIYEGAVDAKEARRLLRGELAPFAGRDRDLDKVAKRAVDELCRGMVALALGRDADVPASCATLRAPLARYAVVVKAMLAA